MSRRMTNRLMLAGMLVVLAAGAAHAGFRVVEDFDDLAVGAIGDRGGWIAPASTSAVAVDPADPDNHVLEVTTASTFLFHDLLLPADAVRMMFLRFRFADQLNASFGLTDAAIPTQFGDFEVELALNNTRGELRVNDDGVYDDVALVEAGVWYNVWIYVDNAKDEFGVWMHDRDGEPATAGDRLLAGTQKSFGFRGFFSGDLVNFFIKTGGGDGVDGPLYLDDIQLETSAALDLANPVAAAVDPDRVPRVGPVAVFPNPFNPRTSVSFELAVGGFVRAEVFDLAGRRVSVLAAGDFPAGAHTLPWLGADDAGRALPSGAYMLRLQAGDEVRTVRMALVR